MRCRGTFPNSLSPVDESRVQQFVNLRIRNVVSWVDPRRGVGRRKSPHQEARDGTGYSGRAFAGRQTHRCQSADRPAQEIRQIADEYKFVFRPLHEGVKDPDLPRFFGAFISRTAPVKEICERLRSIPGIEAAFTKGPVVPA